MKLSFSFILMALASDLAVAEFDHDLTGNLRSRRLCKEKDEGCLFDADCCTNECTGVFNRVCGHTEGREGDYCNPFYYCQADLLCHQGKCEDYRNLLKRGTKGQCRPGNTDDKFKMMTYNVFLLDCPIGAIGPMKCQSDDARAKRVTMIGEWFKDRDEDVVVMQEVFTFEEKVIEQMASAGFCHYVMNFLGAQGSGLAVFSKWPIEDLDFIDWFDLVGKGEGAGFGNLEGLFSEKGVMYAKVNKNGNYHHVFNTHTQSNSMGNGHEIRMKQYLMMREFVESKNIPEDELITMGGDFNEDFWHDRSWFDPKSNKHYHSMVKELDVDINPNVVPVIDNGTLNSQDTEKNKMLKAMWKGDSKYETFDELLDYVFISKNGKDGKQISADSTSFCEILIPQVPKGCNDAECMVSDHFPNTCTFYMKGVKKPNGEVCHKTEECLSKRCSHKKICENLLESGEPCNELGLSDKDCKSGQCTMSFTGFYCE